MGSGDPRGTSGQRWDPERYARNARFVAEYGLPVVELLEPKPGERILDLGCGDGALTLKLLELGADVVGVDASTEQIVAAKSLGIEAHVLAGEDLQFEKEFDAVFSNAALHWMKRDPQAVVAGVWRALLPGGRFVGEMGGGANVATILSALLDAMKQRGLDGRSSIPWYFPSVEEYRDRLEQQGFEVRFIDLFPRPTDLPGDIGGWLETFAESFLNAVDEAERSEFITDVRERLRPQLYDEKRHVWIADYVRLRFAAVKPDRR